MNILIFFLLLILIYEPYGETFRKFRRKLFYKKIIKQPVENINPGLRFATSITDLIKLGINASIYDDETLKESFLKEPELVSKYGYPSEIHTVTTPDGYILEMHRIPYSQRAKNNGQPKQPIFLMHGLLDSSSSWIIMRPNYGLGYLLADWGYDVWLGNSRGNRYSRKHTTLKPEGFNTDRSKFWNFSWHEIGVLDLPTMIDHILAKTGFKKLHYIGHSQGGTVGLVLTSQLPQYNDKLISMQLLAPAAFMSRTKGALLKLASLFRGPLKLIVKTVLGMYEFLPNHDILTLLARFVCSESLILSPLVCTNILFLIGGYNPDQINTKMIPIIAGHTPAGASTNNILHYLQLVESKRFCQFDYGEMKNIAKYGQSIPPDYNLNNIKIPVAMYSSDNDILVSSEDIEETASELSNLIEHYKVKDKQFNHLDFVWGIGVVELLYNRVYTNLKLAEQMK